MMLSGGDRRVWLSEKIGQRSSKISNVASNLESKILNG